MRPELQDSLASAPAEGRTEAVSTKVTPTQKRALQMVAGVRQRDLSSLIYELAVEPLLNEAERVREKLAEVAV